MKVLRSGWFVLFLAAAAWAQDALGKGLFAGESCWVWLPSLGRGERAVPPQAGLLGARALGTAVCCGVVGMSDAWLPVEEDHGLLSTPGRAGL